MTFASGTFGPQEPDLDPEVVRAVSALGLVGNSHPERQSIGRLDGAQPLVSSHLPRAVHHRQQSVL